MDWFTALLCSIFLSLSGLALATGQDYRRRDRALLVTLSVICSLALFAAPAVSRYYDFLNWCAEHHAERSWPVEVVADVGCLVIALWFAWSGFHYGQVPHLGAAGPLPTWTSPAPRLPTHEPTIELPAHTTTTTLLPPELSPLGSSSPPPLPPKDTASPSLPPRSSPQRPPSSPAPAVQSSPSQASPPGPPAPDSSLVLPSLSRSSPPQFSPLQPTPVQAIKAQVHTPSPLRESTVISYTAEGSPTGIFIGETIVDNGAEFGKSEMPLIEI